MAGVPDPGRQIGAALDRLAPEGGLGIAVSGGGDSIALLTMAADWARRRGRPLHAVTVDHGLRPESAAEAAFVGAYAAHIGVPHRVLQAGPMARGNLQAAARAARYALMAEWACETGLAAVALGHSMDDQAETLLLRLARGAGVEGLSAMAARRDWQGIVWIRPMLGVGRAALRDWLRARGIAWVDDPTNEDGAYQRIRARRALAALAPLGMTVDGLATTARMLARQRRVLVRAAAALEATAVAPGPFGEVRIDLAALREDERDTALRVLADALVRVGGGSYRPRSRALEPMLERLLGPAPRTMTLAGCLLVPDRAAARVLICREPARVAGSMALCDGAVWDARWRMAVPAGLAGLWRVGALGAKGCTLLGQLAEKGAWNPGPAWRAAPRQIRQTVPAIFPGAPADSAPMAVPGAAWVGPGAPPALGHVAAHPARGAKAAP